MPINTVTTVPTTPTQPIKYKWKGNKKQRDFMQYWLDPTSETFGNGYRSALKAGFSKTYSLHLVSTAPSWLSEYMQKLELHPEHIKQGISKIATGEINSRSVDDTRLKAYEMLAKYAGMDHSNTTHITVVQPILAGQSVQPPKQVDVDQT